MSADSSLPEDSSPASCRPSGSDCAPASSEAVRPAQTGEPRPSVPGDKPAQSTVPRDLGGEAAEAHAPTTTSAFDSAQDSAVVTNSAGHLGNENRAGLPVAPQMRTDPARPDPQAASLAAAEPQQHAPPPAVPQAPPPVLPQAPPPAVPQAPPPVLPQAPPPAVPQQPPPPVPRALPPAVPHQAPQPTAAPPPQPAAVSQHVPQPAAVSQPAPPAVPHQAPQPAAVPHQPPHHQVPHAVTHHHAPAAVSQPHAVPAVPRALPAIEPVGEAQRVLPSASSDSNTSPTSQSPLTPKSFAGSFREKFLQRQSAGNQAQPPPDTAKMESEFSADVERSNEHGPSSASAAGSAALHTAAAEASRGAIGSAAESLAHTPLEQSSYGTAAVPAQAHGSSRPAQPLMGTEPNGALSNANDVPVVPGAAPPRPANATGKLSTAAYHCARCKTSVGLKFKRAKSHQFRLCLPCLKLWDAQELCSICFQQDTGAEADEWVECGKCKIWVHDSCAGVKGLDLAAIEYTCPACKPKPKVKPVKSAQEKKPSTQSVPAPKTAHGTMVPKPAAAPKPEPAAPVPAVAQAAKSVSKAGQGKPGTGVPPARAVAHLTGIKRDAPDSELTEKEDTIKDDDEPWEPIHTPMPLRLGSLTIVDLGRIEFDKPKFHDTNYIWPVGFTSTRVYYDLNNPDKKIVYTSTILDMDDKPTFRVTPEGAAEGFTANTSTAAWTMVGDRVSRMRATKTAISGPHFFGLTHPEVVRALERLPNANRCKQYIMKKSLPPKSGDVHKKSRNTAHKNVPSDKKDDEDDDGTWEPAPEWSFGGDADADNQDEEEEEEEDEDEDEDDEYSDSSDGMIIADGDDDGSESMEHAVRTTPMAAIVTGITDQPDFHVTRWPLTIGRKHSQVDGLYLQLNNDKTISREHVRVSVDQASGTASVLCLSKNNIKVGSKIVNGSDPAVVVEGNECRLRVGMHDLTLNFIPASGTSSSTATDQRLHEVKVEREHKRPRPAPKVDKQPKIDVQTCDREDERPFPQQIRNIQASMLWLREQFLLFPLYALKDHAHKVEHLRQRLLRMVRLLQWKQRRMRRKEESNAASEPGEIHEADDINEEDEKKKRPLLAVGPAEMPAVLRWLNACLEHVDPWQHFSPNDTLQIYDGPSMRMTAADDATKRRS